MNSAAKRAFLICTAATALLLSGCAYDRTAYAGRAEIGYGAPLYYDGFYGPFWDGYWGPDGFFYFYDRDGHHYHRDDGHHFRHEAAGGYHSVTPRIAGRAHRFPSQGLSGAEHGGAMRQRRG